MVVISLTISNENARELVRALPRLMERAFEPETAGDAPQEEKQNAGFAKVYAELSILLGKLREHLDQIDALDAQERRERALARTRSAAPGCGRP